ncbi:hypothetical protein OA77_22655 [Pseudomonas coronafaciens]|nr:hypothetical protein OA77_22655 [Pseudomonas coronafaciens]
MLTTLYPDDIPALGSLTSGIVGLIFNAGVFVVCAVAIKPSADEVRRVDELFAMAAPQRRHVSAATAMS